MKKLKSTVIAFGTFGILLSAASCKKCVTCTYTYGSGVSTEQDFCKADDMTRDEWDAYVRDLEDGNTECK